MKIEAVVFDMDGTLLDSQKQLPNGFFEAVKQLKALNIQCMIASGRQYERIVEILGEHRHDFIVIGDNGTLLYQDDQLIGFDVLDYSLVKQCLDIILAHKQYMVVMAGASGSHISSNVTDKELMVVAEYCAKYFVCDDLYQIRDCGKLAIYDESDEFEVLKELQPFSDRLKITRSGVTWVDLYPLEASKGIGLSKVCQLRELDLSRVMVFGDAMNDYEMFQVAGVPVLMANGDQALKPFAKVMTKSNDEQGVMLVLNQLLADQGVYREENYRFL